MTRRQVATITGLLLLLCTSFAIMILPGQSDGQDEKFIVDRLIRITATPTIVGQGQFLPPGGDGPGAAIGISVPGGDLTDAMTVVSSPEMIAALQAEAERKYGPGESVPVGGSTTRGSIITIAGRDIQMPDNVEIDGFLSNASCPVGVPCLIPPIYTLRNNETRNTIGVSVRTGMVGDPGLPPDELAAIRTEFQWLVDALATPTPTPAPAATSPLATPAAESQQQ